MLERKTRAELAAERVGKFVESGIRFHGESVTKFAKRIKFPADVLKRVIQGDIEDVTREDLIYVMSRLKINLRDQKILTGQIVRATVQPKVCKTRSELA